jgi:predicted dehydrogenase/aryl-alcohol dehydrogenase-like predicted oxidoreductase
MATKSAIRKKGKDGKLGWGILGAGRIAQAFVRGVAVSKTGQLVAVGSRTQDKADKFGQEFSIPHRHGSYEALLADPEVQAVYVATPHPQHAEWAIRAAEAGKHVLCEKPMGVNQGQAMTMFEAAVRAGVFMMEAFMYRCHPQTARLVELLRTKAIGDVRVIEARFGFGAGFDPESRLFKNDLAGGGILDVGCYPVSLARLVAGVAAGRDFADPLDVKGVAHLGQTGVDEYASAVLKFAGDIVAEVATSITVGRDNSARIYGSAGSLTLSNPWVCNRTTAESTEIVLRTSGRKEPEIIKVEADRTSFSLEADVFAAAIAAGRPAHPAMSAEDTLGNLKTLDRWRESIGLEYAMEKAPAPVSARPLARRKDAPMTYGKIPGLKTPVSRLVMGVDNQKAAPHAFALFDDYFERGGNCFDCAWIYGGGACERVLGHWVRTRGLRGQVVLLDKGAHTPFCDPASITRQLTESLTRLGTDRVDIYLMHRDNPAVPVGEFVDVLNEHKKAGRIGVFGGSNWTLARVDEANAYARKKKLAGFSIVSNQFSLARMVEPVWGGCLSASDAESRAWFEKTQTTLMPWSSQARGFFLPGRANPEDRSDPELVKCWYAPDNFQRLQRANELAAKRGVSAINVALAYVLAQPFPTFPLIGPRSLAETRTSLAALSLKLSPKEIRWLNLEE